MLTLLLPLALSNTARAEDAPATVVALNTVGVMGFAAINVGRMGLSVEHVRNGRHGLLLEGGTIHLHGDPNHLWAFGGALGYRHHFGGASDAPFVGVRVSGESGYGRYVIDQDSVDPKADDANIDLSLLTFTGTAHVGYRWSLTPRVVVGMRVGAGYGWTDIQATETDPRADEAVWFAYDRWQRTPFVVDTELSIGVRLGRVD
jgi:hypothetical protein